MKILFLTDNFPPEVNAPASRTFDHVKVWQQMGHEVTIVTCAPNFPKGKVYDGYKNKLYQVEYFDGIKIVRVWSYITANEGFVKRTLDFISFSVTSFIAGLFIKCDVIIATSPQFFTALSGRTLSLFKRRPWVMEVRDLWPESIKTVGAVNDGVIIRYFEWQEMRCYKSAKKIIVVTDSFKDILVNRGIDSTKIHVVKNGVNRELFKPMSKDVELIKQLQLEGKQIIGYIGTHGMAHKLDFILECAKKIETNRNYHFILIGAGAEKNNLLQLKEKLQLTNVTMLDSVPKTQVKRYISILDCCLINLRKSDLFKTVIPSKIFENAAMQIPIIMGVEGEAKDIVEGYNAGVCFEPENEQDFISKLDSMLHDTEKYTEYQVGCVSLAKDYDRGVLAKSMIEVIANCLN